MARYRRSHEVDASEVGDQVVLFHRGHRTSLVLNATGSAIWTRLAEPCSLEALVAAVNEAFDAPDGATVEDDCHAYMVSLLEHDVVVLDG